MRAQGASSLPQLQQVTDPDNGEDPQGDQLPAGVMFPVGDGFARQWVTGPQGAVPKGAQAAMRGLPEGAAQQWGYAHAIEGASPMHKEEWQYSPQRHGDYLRSYNRTAGVMHGLMGRAPMDKREYAEKTGRPDLHSHYIAAYADGRKAHAAPGGAYATQQVTSGLQAQADAWSAPHATTDDLAAPYNSPETTPPMTQPGGDYPAGLAAGKADKAAGQRPAFADNSSGVSQYVKGYAEGYAGAQAPAGQQDVPYALGGDSGQAANAQQAAQSFQVARASLSFAPAGLFGDGEFSKGYLFASKWRQGARLVSQGSAAFEAGLYAGMTDARPSVQRAWLSAHASGAGSHPALARRIALHRSFTSKHARRLGLRAEGAYVRAAGTSTDLITDGPGASPDPMGATPLNGPGTPPPMGGRGDASAPGGAPPYQGAPPLPGGPVVPDDVMGKPQQAAQPSGPFTQTFSGAHPGNAALAPAAPNSAAQPGYSNKEAYDGDPRGGDRTASARLAAFRDRVQAGLATMGAQ